MKKLLFLLSMAVAILCISCEKNIEGPGEVYGKWKLFETLNDPGDGSGKYVRVKGNQYLVLKKSGNAEGEAMPGVTSFRIIDSLKMEINAGDSNMILIYGYKVSDKHLWIYPPCIEGCGLHFIRQN